MKWMLKIALLASGLTAGIFSSTARSAIRWPSDGEVIDAIIQFWAPYVHKIIEEIKAFVKTITPEMTDQTIKGTAYTADAIKQTTVDVHNSNVKRATEPTPKECNDPALADAANTLMEKNKQVARISSFDGDMQAAAVQTSKSRNRRRHRLNGERLTPNGIPNMGAAIATPLVHPYGSENDQDMLLLIQRLLGEADEMAVMFEGEESDSSLPYEDRRAEHLARLSVVRNALMKMRARRRRNKETLNQLRNGATKNDKALLDRLASKDGISMMDMFQYDVQRTYDNPGFWDAINQAADPTPVSKVWSSLNSTNQALQHEVADAMEDRSLLIGLLGLLKLESKPIDSSAFTAAAKGERS